MEHKLHEEKRKNNELQERLDNPLPNERANRLGREVIHCTCSFHYHTIIQNEYLRQDMRKLEERLKGEKRNSEEWRRKYEQTAAHPRPNPVEDDLRRRVK